MISKANLQSLDSHTALNSLSPPKAGEAWPFSSCTHQSQWGCSSRWCCQSHWWLCKCRFLHLHFPPPWFSTLAEGSGTWSSRCGWYVHPSSTWWEVGGHPQLGTGAWWSSLASLTDDESLYRQSWGGLQKRKEELWLILLVRQHGSTEESSNRPWTSDGLKIQPETLTAQAKNAGSYRETQQQRYRLSARLEAAALPAAAHPNSPGRPGSECSFLFQITSIFQ